jgi:hypothetical protein
VTGLVSDMDAHAVVLGFGHEITGEISKPTEGLTLGRVDASQLLPLLIHEDRPTIVSVELVAGHNAHER